MCFTAAAFEHAGWGSAVTVPLLGSGGMSLACMWCEPDARCIDTVSKAHTIVPHSGEGAKTLQGCHDLQAMAWHDTSSQEMWAGQAQSLQYLWRPKCHMHMVSRLRFHRSAVVTSTSSHTDLTRNPTGHLVY